MVYFFFVFLCLSVTYFNCLIVNCFIVNRLPIRLHKWSKIESKKVGFTTAFMYILINFERKHKFGYDCKNLIYYLIHDSGNLYLVAPMLSRIASLLAFRSTAEMSLPTDTPVTKWIPSAARRSIRRWTTSLESFIVGMPY
jgi:hypothetical protein